MTENPRAAHKQRPAPPAPSGEAWQRGEQCGERLAETRDTTSSFIVKGAIGTALLTAVPVVTVWLLFKFIGWLLS
jgi:hypothetical protein